MTFLFFVLLITSAIKVSFAFGVSVHYPLWSMNESVHPKIHRSDVHTPFANWRNFSKSQNHEDIDAYENYFYGLHNGLVMETGGGGFSATLFFERVVNWRAIQDPKVFKKLRTTRSNQLNVHAALCSRTKVVHLMTVQDVVTIYEAIIAPNSTVDPTLLDIARKQVQGNQAANTGSLQAILCVPITQLLQRLGFEHVDLWILDTDGNEDDVLRGLDVRKVKIDVIAFPEENILDTAREEATARKISILEQKGYNCSRHAHENRWCKRKGFHNASSRPALLRKPRPHYNKQKTVSVLLNPTNTSTRSVNTGIKHQHFGNASSSRGGGHSGGSGGATGTLHRRDS